MKDYTQSRLEELKGWMENVLELDVEREYIKSFLTNSIAQAEQEMLKKYAEDMNLLNKLHSMELDALSLKSLEDFMKWSGDRRYTPVSPLSSLDKEINNKEC